MFGVIVMLPSERIASIPQESDVPHPKGRRVDRRAPRTREAAVEPFEWTHRDRDGEGLIQGQSQSTTPKRGRLRSGVIAPPSPPFDTYDMTYYHPYHGARSSSSRRPGERCADRQRGRFRQPHNGTPRACDRSVAGHALSADWRP